MIEGIFFIFIFPLAIVSGILVATSRGEFFNIVAPVPAKYRQFYFVLYLCAKLVVYVVAGYLSFLSFDLVKGDYFKYGTGHPQTMINEGEFENEYIAYILSFIVLAAIIFLAKYLVKIYSRRAWDKKLLTVETAPFLVTYFIVLLCINLGIYPFSLGAWGVGPT